MNRQQRRKAERERQEALTKKQKEIARLSIDPIVKIGLLIQSFQQSTTVKLLREEKTPIQATKIVLYAAGYAEDNIAEAHKAFERAGTTVPALACRAGCSWCCYQQTEVSPVEAIAIVAYLRDALSPEDFEELRAKVTELDNVTRGMNQDERFELLRPCVLLDAQGRCRVYDVRPLSCRGYNSTDVDICKKSVENPKTLYSAPADGVRFKFFIDATKGLYEGLEEAGFQVYSLELTAALRLAMEDPQVGDRWLQGEPVFEKAKLIIDPASARNQKTRIDLFGIGGA